MKINNNYKNYFKIIKQFNKHRYCLLKASLSVNKLLSLLFLNIMPDTAKQFKIFNQMSEDGKTIPNYHYIKQRFNHFVNKKLNYNHQNKMKNNHLNMVTNRWNNRSHSNTVLNNQNNNFSNTESNLNNISNTLYNQCGSSDHKGINCSHKNKICNYCKRKEHL